MDTRETNSDYEMEKVNLQIFTLKNVLRIIIPRDCFCLKGFLKTNCLDVRV